jgi:CheY-like chemotaxis protein
MWSLCRRGQPPLSAPVSGTGALHVGFNAPSALLRDAVRVQVSRQATALRVVIVDDNRLFLDAARDVLEREGASVLGVASTGRDALSLVAQLQPDAVLVDVDLGEESGFDLAERIAAAGSTHVVMISAYPESELVDLIAASPAAGFVSKAELSATAVVDALGDDRGPGD